jgi:crotonobetainyl-CoA:carnitine CoA-transferase CaiB-like acyl-CoA transferase
LSALQGIRVVDLTHIMAGPTCTLMLADMGAEVIKVEKVPGGDDTRRMLPPDICGESAAYMMMNRNKTGIALDLRRKEAKEVLWRLIDTADVLVENYRKGTLDRLGFPWEEVSARNPRLVWCAISGFGRTGPYAERGGFDLVAQAMSGIMSVTGTKRGDPPVKCGVPLTDITAGMLGVVGILAALVERERSGRGQYVDTSLYEAGITHTYWQSAITLATGISPGPMGSAHPLSAPYQAFATRDGWIVIGASNQSNWLRLTRVLGAPELAEDPRFRENADRMRHLGELEAELTRHFRTRTTAEWLELLERAGVPAGPVNEIADMLEDPQTLAREMRVQVPHTRLGAVDTIGLPVKFSRTPGGPKRGAPLYGEHTREVLRGLGYSEEEIGALLASGAAVAADAP